MLLAACVAALSAGAEEALLAGTVMATEMSVDYSTGLPSTTVNTGAAAFDGDLDTFFASYDRSFTWTGLDLGEPCVVTRVGIAPRNDTYGPRRVVLGVFQGANSPDFSDAMPIFMVTEPGVKGKMAYYDVDCSRGFRYVRYVGPSDARCNVAEIEFYGYPSEGDDSHFYQPTNLPLVVVNTPGMEWFHEYDNKYPMEGSTVYIIADGALDVAATAQIRGRGNGSWTFPKKPFRIKFDEKQRVLGSPGRERKWVMVNNYGDKTLMRNRLAFDISERLGMAFTPSCRFVDLIFNGEFQGAYQLCDAIVPGKHRVDITQMTPEDTEGEALTGGYLVEVDAYATSEDPSQWFYTYNGYSLPVTIQHPDAATPEQYEYVSDRMNELTARLKATNFTDPARGYRSRLDIDSFLRHFIVGELSGNTDTYWSTFMTLDRGTEQFVVGPVWDFDLAFENDGRTYPLNRTVDYVFRRGSHAGDMKQFVARIIDRDSEARDSLTYIWSYARECQGIDDDTFDALIDSYAAELEASQRLNFMRWPIMNRYVHQNPVLHGSYGAEVENVRTYIHERLALLDRLIGRCEVSALPASTADAAADVVAVYTLQGISLGRPDPATLAPGVYILRLADGSSRKIIR